MRRYRSVVVSVGATLLGFAAPAFSAPAAPDATPGLDAAWFVVGIQPGNMRLEIDEPRVKNGRIWSFKYNLEAYRPVDGFVVFKARPGVTYAIAAASAMAGKSIFGIRYKACDHVPTFRAEAGKVIYFTTISYQSDGMRPDYFGTEFFQSSHLLQDLDGARTFMRSHYPGLANALEQGQAEVMPVARAC